MASVGLQTVSPFSKNMKDIVEENGSRTPTKAYTYQHTKCYACCGYYGSCHDQPFCVTCHAFLYPSNIDGPGDPLLMEVKSDSEDSGNEEPTDFYETVQAQPEPSRRQRQFVFQFGKPNKCDQLAECISALSCPRTDSVPDNLVENLPLEVLTALFSYLDDLSLWTCERVCKRWCQILINFTTEDKWHGYVIRKWPLFRPLYNVTCWRTVYTRLLESANCLTCLYQMMNNRCFPSENPWRTNRLQHELKSLKFDQQLDGIEAFPMDNSFCHWQACIIGPEDSPYEGGNFFLYLRIPYGYPMRPPIVHFITKIFHPNISRHGDIGLDSLQHNWSLALTIAKILISIQSLLTDPYCSVCMEPEIGKLYTNDRSTFDYTARLWTHLYASNHRFPITSMPEVSWHALESG